MRSLCLPLSPPFVLLKARVKKQTIHSYDESASAEWLHGPLAKGLTPHGPPVARVLHTLGACVPKSRLDRGRTRDRSVAVPTGLAFSLSNTRLSLRAHSHAGTFFFFIVFKCLMGKEQQGISLEGPGNFRLKT